MLSALREDQGGEEEGLHTEDNISVKHVDLVFCLSIVSVTKLLLGKGRLIREPMTYFVARLPDANLTCIATPKHTSLVRSI